MAELIAPGTTLTTFAAGEFTCVAGTPRFLYIKPAVAAGDGVGVPNDVMYEVAYKTSGGNYIVYLVLTATNIARMGAINGNGVYAARRLAANTSSGLDVN